MNTEDLYQFLEIHLKRVPALSGLIVACSGGPDSVALAYALKEIEPLLKRPIYLAHVNHGLRGRASAGDESFVRALARQWGWPFLLKKKKLARLKRGNLEEKARDDRYAAFIHWAEQKKARVILTAHNLDDQAETILMNLMRGSSPRGLGGMRPTRILKNKIVLMRPLLGTSKADLLLWLKQHQYSFRQDQTNRDQQFLRNWLRLKIIPMLDRKRSGLKKRLLTLSTLIQAEEDFWESEVDQMMRRLCKAKRGGVQFDFQLLRRYSVAHQRRFLRRVAGKDLLSFDALESLRDWMKSPPTSGLIKELRKGWIAQRLSKQKGSPSTSVFWLGHQK